MYNPQTYRRQVRRYYGVRFNRGIVFRTHSRGAADKFRRENGGTVVSLSRVQS